MATGDSISGIYYKPLMMITYSLIWNAGDHSPFLFHLTQLILHILNSFLVFILFKEILKDRNAYYPIVAGLLFLIHPINSEAVLFIADMQEPLYTFFGLLAMMSLIFLKPLPALIFSSLLLFCSLLSKESGALYLVACLSYCAIYRSKLLKTYVAAISLVVFGYLYLRLNVANLSSVLAHDMKIANADLTIRLLTMPKVLMHYIYLFIYPVDISLTQDWVVSQPAFVDFFLPAILFLLVLSFLFYFLIKRFSKAYLFFLIWFLSGWALHSQLIPLDGTVSDRWFYFTFIGLVGLIFQIIPEKLKVSKAAQFAAITLICTSFALRSYARTKDWKNAYTLYHKDILVDPESFYINNNLGLIYFSSGKYEESLLYFEKTVKVTTVGSRIWYVALTNLGAAYLFKGDFVKAESVLAKAILGGDIKAYRAYAGTLLNLQKIEIAKSVLIEALAKYPSDNVLMKLKSNPALQ